MRVLILVACCLVFTRCVECADVRKNLIRNGGFEIVDQKTGLPANWSFAWQFTHSSDRALGRKKHRPDYGLDESQVKKGRRSFRISVKNVTDDGVLSQENVPAVKGTKVYLIRAWIRTENLHNTSANVGVVFLDAENRWLGARYSAIAATENHDWRQYAGLVSAPPQTDHFRVRLWLNFRYSGTGCAWFDDVEMTPTPYNHEPPTRYIESRIMPEMDPSWQKAGFVLFRRSWLDLAFPCTVPKREEIGGTIKVFATPGEYEPISFCIRSLKNLHRVKFSFSNLVSKDGGVILSSAIEPGVVRLLYRRGQERWGPFAAGRMRVPIYIEKTSAFDIGSDTTRWIWATLHVPANAAPGVYEGDVSVKPAIGEERSICLRVTVAPVRLGEAKGVVFGMYERFHDEPGLLEKMFKDMRRHGMTSVGFCGPLGAKMVREEESVDVLFDGESVLERAMDAYAKAGFPEPFVWLMGADVYKWCLKQGDLHSEAFARAYRAIIEAILRRRRERGWPEIIFQPVDEPFEHTGRLGLAKRCLEILKSIPGVRTEEDGPNGNPSKLDELYPLCDVLVLHDGPVVERGRYDAKVWETFLDRAHKDGKEIWFYNIDLTAWHPEVMRWGYGFGLWFSGAKGMIEWAYQFKTDKVYENEGSIVYVFPRTEKEPGGPTIGWEAIREGVDDYKYIAALDAAICQAEQSADPLRKRVARQAKEYMEQLRKKTDFHAQEGRACQGDWTGTKAVTLLGQKVVAGSYKMANGWIFEDYDAARRKIAAFLVKLQKDPEK